MALTDAAFDNWEQSIALYLAQHVAMPGMTLSAGGSTIFSLRLLTADPRAAIIYPNAFAAVGGFNATYEPTQAIYQGYDAVPGTRNSGAWTVGASGGGYSFKNAIARSFPTSGVGSAGAAAYIYGVGFCLRNWQATHDFMFATCPLTVPMPITAGGGDTPTFQINALEFFVK